MLNIKNIDLYNGKLKILDNASLQLGNEPYVLIGKNGTGKSTLFKFLANIKKGKNGYLNLKESIFYLPEKVLLPKSIKVNKLLEFYIGLTDSLESGEFWLRRYKVDGNKEIRKLSKGMLQKVGIILSLIDNSKIILYDEPFEGLDNESIKQFISDIKEVHKDKTVIIAIHELSNKIRLSFKKIEIEDYKLCLNN